MQGSIVGGGVFQGYKDKQKEARQGAERGGPWSMRILREVLELSGVLVGGDIAARFQDSLIKGDIA